jgi:hypothetical protein
MIRSCPNLTYYFDICMEGLRKTAETLSQCSRPAGRDVNLGPPEYKRVLTTRQLYSVLTKRC